MLVRHFIRLLTNMLMSVNEVEQTEICFILILINDIITEFSKVERVK